MIIAPIRFEIVWLQVKSVFLGRLFDNVLRSKSSLQNVLRENLARNLLLNAGYGTSKPSQVESKVRFVRDCSDLTQRSIIAGSRCWRRSGKAASR